MLKGINLEIEKLFLVGNIGGFRGLGLLGPCQQSVILWLPVYDSLRLVIKLHSRQPKSLGF